MDTRLKDDLIFAAYMAGLSRFYMHMLKDFTVKYHHIQYQFLSHSVRYTGIGNVNLVRSSLSRVRLSSNR